MDIIKNYDLIELKYDTPNKEFDQINKEGKACDPMWLSEQVVKGVITEKDKGELLDMINTLETVCGDLWDIQVAEETLSYSLFHFNPEGYGLQEFWETRRIKKMFFRIILKFPEITITNSGKKSHVIRDLYTSLIYEQVTGSVIINTQITSQDFRDKHPELEEHNGFYIPFRDFTIRTKIGGKRGTLSPREYEKGYLHSHLPGNSEYTSYYWSIFCLGSGEIVQTLLMLQEGYSSEMFTMLLYQVDAYVRWESREGVPHEYISGLVTGNSISAMTTIPPTPGAYLTRYVTNLLRKRREQLEIYPEREDIRINWKIEDGKIQIIDDEDFDNFVKLDKNIYRYDWSHHIVYLKDREGKYYPPHVLNEVEEADDIDFTPNTFILFRKEQIGFKVVKTKEEPKRELSPGFIINPAIKQHIKQKLEAYGNYNEIRANISKRANKIIHS